MSKKSPVNKTPTKKTPAKKESPKKLPKPPGYPKPESELKFSVIAEAQQWGQGDNRSAPPNKGNKEAPRGPSSCLEGVTIVISGVLDSLEREDAENYIKVRGVHDEYFYLLFFKKFLSPRALDGL